VIAGGLPELLANRADGTTAVKVGEINPADVATNLGILGAGLYTHFKSNGGRVISGNGGMTCPDLTDKP
jgi:hypothetical protein